jgi:hypothetical protein
LRVEFVGVVAKSILIASGFAELLAVEGNFGELLIMYFYPFKILSN